MHGNRQKQPRPSVEHQWRNGLYIKRLSRFTEGKGLFQTFF